MLSTERLNELKQLGWRRFAPHPDRPSFADHFHHLVLEEPNKVILNFINDRGHLSHELSCSMLDAAAQSISTHIKQVANVKVGERVIILCDPGVDFVVTFFGVLYAGAIAVPCYPPMNEKQFMKLFKIGKNCKANTVILSADFYNMIKTTIPEIEKEMGLEENDKLQWLSLGDISNLKQIISKSPDMDLVKQLVSEFVRPELKSDDVAFLQYSSGSTGDPKGVAVTHFNILTHTSTIVRTFEYDASDKDVTVTWLPPYHDMGLIGALLTAACCLTRNYIISPITFVTNPIIWLETITKYKATVTGGPNFGYDFCTNRVTDDQLKKIDLSSLRLCFTGAEPIRISTMNKFYAKFSAAGFKFDSFYPCYGLAEATLMVSGKLTSQDKIKSLTVDRSELQKNKVVIRENTETDDTQVLVYSGYSRHIQPISIVEPNDRVLLSQPYVIGEIWIRRNDNTPIGYWNNEELTKDSFYAEISNGSSSDQYLRTGDLGFVDEDGALFVCGRIKDLIILRGKNIYPQDIEAIMDDISINVRNGCSAAFGVDTGSTEELVVVVEVKDINKQDTEKQEELFALMRKSVSEQLNLLIHTIVLIKQKTIPKTTSGKIRRHESKQLFLENKLEVVAKSYVPQPVAKVEKVHDNAEDILHRIVARVAAVLEIPENSVDMHQPFAEQGLDSLKISQLVGELSSLLQRDISPTIFFEFPNIISLAKHIASSDIVSEKPKLSAVSTHQPNEDIAIVGMACRLPGADSVEEFWDNLLSGLNAPSSTHPQYRAKKSIPAAFINNAFNFDSEFFSISKREAKSMDPQQRILLEVCWEAIEDAGETWERISGSEMGVFIGASSSDFALEGYKHSNLASAHSATGSSLSILANRISYVLNCDGPSMLIDSACSSSLLAVHQACSSIRSGESSMALAGGINMLFADGLSQSLRTANFLSPDGQCKSFDASANGYVRGEGCGVVLLKPLSQAIADNDRVYAVLKGSAVVQDGKSNGLTAPNQKAQEKVIATACRRSGVNPSSYSFVECHGTGTYLGDPIEAQALGKVVGSNRKHPCLIGSVKSNIGHLEAASGISALIKTALSVYHRRLPATVNITKPNPLIPFDKLNLQLARNETKLPDTDVVAGINNFGFGGTNVHIIVSSASTAPREIKRPTATEYLFPISAKSEKSLNLLVGKYINYLQDITEPADHFLADLSYTLALRRSHFAHRLCVCASSLAGLKQELIKFKNGKESPLMKRGISSSLAPKVVFVFPGQGTDYVSQAKPMLSINSFVESLNSMNSALKTYDSSIDVVDAINNYKKYADDLFVVQATIFAVQVALVAYWKSLGVEPDMVVGHSLGEIASAFIAEAITLNDAAKVIYFRSKKLEDKLKGKGRMIFARLSVANAAEIASNIDGVSIAAVNSQNSVTFSGSTQQMAIVDTLLSDNNISHRYLDVDYAFHSSQCVEIAGELLTDLLDLQSVVPRIPVYSTSRNEKVTSANNLFGAQYWVDNIVKSVQFGPCIESILQQKTKVVFIEMSCKEVLTPIIQQIISTSASQISCAVSSLSKSSSALRLPLAALYTSGTAIDWYRSIGDSLGNKFLALPRYSWNSSVFVPEFVHMQEESKSLNINEIIDTLNVSSTSDFSNVKGFAALMDNICITFMLYALSQLGWEESYKRGDVFTTNRAASDLKIVADHRILFNHILKVICENGFLANAGEDSYQVSTNLPLQSILVKTAQELITEGKQKYPEFTAELAMIERSGKELHSVLQGKLTGLQILFPNGSMDNTEALYERSALSLQYNDQVCQFFDQAMQAISKIDDRSAYRQKILEIGAGTGGLTSHVLETLSGTNEANGTKDLRTATVHEYVFTDISKLFLAFAKQKFSSCSYMKYALLDIEKSPSSQGFSKHSYDFILAANVLHATMNLNTTLKNIKQLLKPGGVLVILEVTRPTLFLDLTFGLLDGWWRFSQNGKQDVRDNYPLLKWEQWNNLLIETGFTNVNRVNSKLSDHDEEFQSVIVAQMSQLEENEEEEEEKPLKDISTALVGQNIDESMISDLKNTIASFNREDTLQTTIVESKLQEFIKMVVAHTLMISSSDINAEQSLDSLGMDSLLGLELRNIIQSKLNVKIPISALISEDSSSMITIASLTSNLMRTILSNEPSEATNGHIEQTKEDEQFIADLTDELLEETTNASVAQTNACILAMGVATPKYKYTQRQMAEMAIDYYKIRDDAELLEKLNKIFDGSDINTRYSVVDYDTIDRNIFTSFQSRNEIYEVEAVELAVQSASKALEDWGGDKSKITHLVSVSTTGNKIPGIEFELVHRLGLSNNVHRIAVNFMGCFGALPGLKTAVSFAQQNSANRVLFVSTEICSTHIEKEPTSENFVGAAIFADGSAAAVIGCGNPEFEDFERPHFEIMRTASFAIKNSLDKMYWKVTDSGWRLGLSKDIPTLIFNNIEAFSKELLGAKLGAIENIPKIDADWAVHPGGKAILLAVENALGLSKEQTQFSWKVMSERGNMSSSTILHVLQAMIKHERTNKSDKFKPIVNCMVFGPGLTMEGAILKRCA